MFRPRLRMRHPLQSGGTAHSMPFARVSPRAPVESASPRAVRRLQFAGTAVLILVGVFCALLLAVRFVVFPQVESHRAQIAAYLSSKVGQTVEIDSIATG